MGPKEEGREGVFPDLKRLRQLWGKQGNDGRRAGMSVTCEDGGREEERSGEMKATVSLE